MNTTKRFALSAAAVLGLSAPAFAADVVYQEPPAPAPILDTAPVSSWAGPYAGVHLGYGFSGNTDATTGGVNTNIGTDGWLGGAFGGFNMQSGQFVYGGEADINYNSLDGSNGTLSSRARVDGSLRARAGVAVNDDILVYGTAGVAGERQRLSDGTNSDTNLLVGYTVGAGTDIKLTEQVFARGEYRYTDYGSKTFNLGGTAYDTDSSNHRVTLGIGVKF